MELEAMTSQLMQKISASRAELVSVETLLAQAPKSVLEDLVSIRTGGDDADLF